jgi:hypothetical protein
MLIAGLTVCMTCISSPFFLLSSIISKLRYSLKGVKQLETSKESVLSDIELFVKESNRMFCSMWLFNDTVHVLCRYATIFSNRSPIVILANTCSFDYVEFMRNIPRIYDVYCIDLPTCGLNPIPISQRVNSGLLLCETHLASIILSLSPSNSTKFTIVGESYGVTLITKAITSEVIKLNRVNELILINLPRLSHGYLATKFKICFSHFILKSSWAPWLFAAFLYPRNDVLSRIRTAFKFITDKDQPNMASVWASSFDLKDLFYLSGKLKITLVEDTITGTRYASSLRQRSGNAIKSNNCTLNPLNNNNNKKSVLEFTNIID